MCKNLLFLLALLLLVLSCQNSSKSKLTGYENNEWIELFNGTGTDHWRGFHMDHFPDSGWYVENGELRNDGSGAGGLITKEQYADFILEWEWRLFDEGGNSGVKYFVKERPDREGKYAFGLEYQLLDDDPHANDYHTTGALYEFFPPSPEKQLLALGQFNASKLVVDGNHVEHWLNGLVVVEYERGGEEFLAARAKSKFRDRPDFGLHKEGNILLQDHQSRVGFRNIRIKILDPDSTKD
ncbi:MAG: hypothetical protein AMS23_07805 [Bacteroides sp. SM1_62]|nr:MAG: hypothetical protein AMS26_05300 [Bacteroides sp. SM23_62]KPL22489.1 MAG: hypothetical protein AMS23_07805 [Bacteroides sp. SM1_62]